MKVLNQYSKLFLQLCKPVANIIFTLIKKALAADGLSGHEYNLKFNLAFYIIPGISRDSRDYKPQISLPVPGSQKAFPAHPWAGAKGAKFSGDSPIGFLPTPKKL